MLIIYFVIVLVILKVLLPPLPMLIPSVRKEVLKEAEAQIKRYDSMIYFTQDRRNLMAEERELCSDKNSFLNEIERELTNQREVFVSIIRNYK